MTRENRITVQEPRYLRVRDIVEARRVSKPKVFQLLREGRIEGIKVDGILFIDADSVERWFRSGRPWEPGLRR